MSSLRDKLRDAAPQKKPQKPASQDCFVRETVMPTDGAYAPVPLTVQQLRDMLINNDPPLETPVVRPERVLYLDTETTGLSGGAGTLAFLVGLGRVENGALVVRQYLMRDYDQEAFVLQNTARLLADCDLLVTFNGKSFDMPLLESRFTMQRMRDAYRLPPHLDLLHVARRVWKLRLSRCSLGALEEAVLGITRENDLPGALVPQRFFDYLKTRDFSLLEDVLTHNAQDIASLCVLLYRLSSLHQSPLTAVHREDVYSLGRALERAGQTERARMCYREASCGRLRALCQAGLAESYRRERDYAQAAALYQGMVDRHLGGLSAHVALAKICEHRLRDIPRALAVTADALRLCAERAETDAACARELPTLQKRYERLLAKSRRNTTWVC